MTTVKKVNKILKNGKFVLAQNRIHMTPGHSLRVIRELQELSQNELAKLSGLPQSTISGMESGRINIGVERAKVLAMHYESIPQSLYFQDGKLKKHPKSCKVNQLARMWL